MEDLLHHNDANALQRHIADLECALARRDAQLDLYTNLVSEVRHLIPPVIYNVFIEVIQKVCPISKKK